MSDVVNVVVDLETLDKRPTAAIVAIGAVAFSPAGLSVDREPFYCRVQIESSMAEGGTVDGDTIRWWLSQGQEARAEVYKDGAKPIGEALLLLEVWLPPKVNLWGNGAGFDNVILRTAVERSGVGPLWHFSADRCYRTIKAAFGHLAPVQSFEGYIAHRADHDAARQAQHLVDIHHELAKVGVKLL